MPSGMLLTPLSSNNLQIISSLFPDYSLLLSCCRSAITKSSTMSPKNQGQDQIQLDPDPVTF